MIKTKQTTNLTPPTRAHFQLDWASVAYIWRAPTCSGYPPAFF